MELDLGLALSSSSSSSSSCSSQFDLINCNHTYQSNIPIHQLKKRKYDHVPQTLPLLVWNNFCNKNHSNEEENPDNDAVYEVESSSGIFDDHHRNDDGVIGWPPVKSCRKNFGNSIVNNDGSKSTFVKVHMEGIGIARKVDLNEHDSYQTLVHTLADMFGKCYEDVKLTYQDKDGDWLLAGDVPWGSFIETIQRLKLLRK